MNQKQSAFSDGMDLISKDVDVSPSGYRYGFNMRQRYGYAEGVHKSQDITFNLMTAGNFQGMYAINAIWLAFFSGRAYYMTVGGNSWTQVPSLQLDAFVPYIYIAAVPGSTNNYLRKGILTPGTTTVDARAGIITQPFSVGGTPAGVVCQDGTNIPWLISYDAINNTATARQLGTYNQWDNTGTTSNNMEYVPIGLQMMYLSPTLYIQAPSGNTIYRSVSGSPLNFMINVDSNGNKLPTEALGGATTTSFAVDFDTITCMVPSTTAANVFIVATARFIYGMQVDFTNTIFNEPEFVKAFTLEAGIVNQFSITDINGDTGFIDFEGVKFFNAVQQLKFEGSNDPLSKNISVVLTRITQGLCCAGTFDNYNLFGLNTTLGFVIAVFDNMSKKWVSFDITNATISGVKMFAKATLPNQQFFACGTSNGRLFQLYNSNNTDREAASMIPRGFVSGDYSNYGTFVSSPYEQEHKLNFAKCVVQPGQLDGSMFFIEQVDNQRGNTILSRTVTGVTAGVNYPVIPPIIPNNKKRMQNLLFTLDQGLTGYMINPIITWNSDLRFFGFDIDTSPVKSQQSQSEQQLRTF